MKKIISLVLLATITTATASSVFAATEQKIESAGGSASAEISATATITGGTPVYSVDVTWNLPTFAYTKTLGTWNPATHQYDGTAEGAWTGEGTIGVTNHSNVAVTVNLTSSLESTVEGVTPTFDQSSFDLATAELTELSAAPKAEAKLTMDGEPIGLSDTAMKIGTATVSISAKS